MRRITEKAAGREKASHGDIFLPVNSYHCLVPITYRELALHWHEEMEITLIRDGMSDYRVGQKSFQTQEGDIILVPPYCTHSAFEIPEKTMVSDSLVFHLDLLGAQGQDLSASKYLRPLAEGQLQMPEVIRRPDKGYDKIREAFLEALECFQSRPPFYEMLLREELLHIIILLFQFGYIRESAGSRNSPAGRQQLKTVLQYIAEHYREKIKVADLADMSGFSESYFMSFLPLSDPESGARAGRDIGPGYGDRDGSRLRQYFLFQSAVPTGVRNDTAAVPDETERSGKITSEIVCL